MADGSPQPRILAIHAHPDDVEFQIAGTLALLKQKGCHITIATMTAGDLGSAELSQTEIANIRRKEAKAAADLLGADYMCLEFGDLAIVVDDASRRRVTEAIRRARPSVVITAPPIDYMADHEVTSRLVRDALFSASVPFYKTHEWDAAPPTEKIPHLYYCDPLEGVDWFGKPVPHDFIVDTTSTNDLKMKMLAAHDSQRAWLRRQHGVDEYLDSCTKWSGKRGAVIGKAHGEAFRQHLGHPYPHSNIIAELLGPLCHVTQAS
ncbi:Mycothiol S-conjugate amidase [Caulifigura coniformis]|uniref:Mycothiol S-conjugate amidase n=1 Tax=Caulifigura coniformis TaxID=2527983 RepID=A0A517SJ37_9PLAN|nr:PIG-L family deacetylase [Caulifigura coniformis]QDT56125.1 Mycothiol S-conjugate amidase [Caulifigura coniformis]